MSKICYECHRLLFDIQENARKEVNRRLDNGEDEVDLYVEYDNQLRRAVENGVVDEGYWFLRFASEWCISSLGYSKVRAAGWTSNRSGFWVKREA